MKTNPTRFDNRTRPRWWPALLSLLVVFSLVVQPICQCAMAQAAHNHAHADEAARGGQECCPEDAAQHADHHSDAHHDPAEHHHSTHRSEKGASVSSPIQAHLCCCDNEVIPGIAVLSRPAAPEQSHFVVAFAPAKPPVALDVFALTYCHGRDGPPDKPFLSHSSASSLLGRAPPVAV